MKDKINYIENTTVNFLNVSYSNSDSTQQAKEESHHKDYILGLFVLLLGFFAWAFYLYNFISHKRKLESLMNQKDEQIANNVKLDNLRYLSIANLSI